MATSCHAFLLMSVASCMALLLIIFSRAVSGNTSSPNILFTTDDVLNEGESISYGNASLTMQKDCNLVLRSGQGNRLFNSKTAGVGSGCSLTLSNVGKLNIKDGSGRTVWTSNGPQGSANVYALVIRPDEAIAIYGPVVFGTPLIAVTPPSHASFTWNNVMFAGDYLFVLRANGRALVFGPIVWAAGLDDTLSRPMPESTASTLSNH